MAETSLTTKEEKPKKSSSKSTKKKKKISNNWKKAAIIEGIIILAIIVLCGAYLYGKSSVPSPVDPGPADQETTEDVNDILAVDTVKTILEPASDLVTGKYFYKNAIYDLDAKSIFNKELPFTQTHVVFTYEGVIHAGYDLSQIKDEDIDINNEEKTITITLPKVKLIASEVDDESYDYVFEKKSIFNDEDLKHNQETKAKLKKQMNEKAMSDPEFIRTVEYNGKQVIKRFLQLADASKEYTIKFKKAEGK